MSDNKNKNKDRRKDVLESSKEDRAQITSATGDISNIGDTGRNTIDTGDIARASIAKGIRGPDDGSVTAADIIKGRTKPDDIISYTTGISAETGKVLNPQTEASITKDLDKDITTTNSEEDVSKLVSSGTTSTKSGGIDKADMYSSDDSSRHLEKVQETTTKKVEHKEDNTTSSES